MQPLKPLPVKWHMETKLSNLKVNGEKGSFFIPDIDFNIDAGIFSMSGESYLENTAEFYAPILDWIKKFTENYKKDIQFNVSLQYYNTSSSRSILDILRLIKEHENKGNKVSVNWFHTGEDPEVYEEVEDYRLETGLNIQLCLEEE